MAVDFAAEVVPEVAYSCTSNGVLAGEGNISANPRFVDAAAGDFRLDAGSPCRGTGRSGTDMGALPGDGATQQNRFVRCDATGDGLLDLTDAIRILVYLFQDSSQAPACLAAGDCNSTAVLDLSDPVFLLNYLFVGTVDVAATFPACDAAPPAECAVSTGCLD
jgi:hypothetical protein